MHIKTFGSDKITTYKFKLLNYNIMLDFDGAMDLCDVSDIDFLLISHDHFDHISNFLNYDLLKSLNPNCHIYATETTRKIIISKLISHMYQYGFDTEKRIFITEVINKIEPIYYERKISISDELFITFYKSGHTFGSSMIYLEANDTNILYTGDIDYVKNNKTRSYDLPYNLKVDYLICDGTNIFDTEYKGVNKRIRDYINKKTKTQKFYYYAKPEKAILYALSIKDDFPDFILVYSKDLIDYIKIVYEQGYDIFDKNKLVLEIDDINLDEHFSGKKMIIFTSNDKKYDLDYRLSLHITSNDLIELINTHFVNEPKILIGHYDKKSDLTLPIELDKAIILTKENEV